MLESILRLLHIACSHRHTSKPFSKSKPSPRSDNWDAVTGTGHYVVCFDCGKELTYDWQQMRITQNG
jgi:hypothetical protein